MFWRFGGYANISTIDTLLDKPDTTLETLLEEPDLIQELKQHNTKLIEFIREDAVIRKLLEYVIAPKAPAPTVVGLPGDSKPLPAPPEEDETDDGDKEATEKPTDKDATSQDGEGSPAEEASAEKDDKQAETSPAVSEADREKVEKTRLKYSYVACEVLSSEAWSICEALMDNLENLRMFWKFLERAAPLDPLQAGYFTKVNETLFDKKTGEMMDFFKSIENIVPMMLKHIDTPLIMDLLLKIISMEKSDGGNGIVDWLCSKDLIPRLLSFLSPDHSSTTQTSTGDFLKAIITISANASQNEQSCIGPNNLTRQLVSETCIQTLIEAMLKGGNPLTVGVGIIIEVIRKNNSDYDPELAGGIDSIPSGRDPIYLGNLLRLFAKHVPDFTTLILNSDPIVINEDGTKTTRRRELKAAFGGTIEPLGFDRFKTCELMAELLHCSNMGLLNERGSDEYVRQRDSQRERLRQQREHDLATLVAGRQDVGGAGLYGRSEYLGDRKDEEEFENVAVGTVLEEIKEGEFEDHEKVKPSAVEDVPGSPKGSPRSPPKSPTSEPVVTELEVPTTSQPTGALSPVSEAAQNVKDVKLDDDEDTIMRSPPPPAPLDKLSSDDDKSDAEKPDQHMSSPPPITATLASPVLGPGAIKDEKDDKETAPTEVPGAPSDKLLKELRLDAEVLQAEGIELDLDGRPLVGDYLKMMFVQHQVVPTILDFFFRFPWNNFLHNVVYDVVQQVFNGPMDRGFNRHLAIDLFIRGRITNRIVDGQKQSDKTQAEANMRLGYMGHLTLIAEEVVKFTERQPPELLSPAVYDKVVDPDWVYYVEQTLAETRERDNAILGGVRPDMMGPGRPGMGGSIGGVSQTFGGSSGSSGMGQSGAGDNGLDTIDLRNSGIGEGEVHPTETFDGDDGDVGADIGSRDGLRAAEGHDDKPGGSGFGSSSDEDEDEDMNMGDDDDEVDEVAKLGILGNSDQTSPGSPEAIKPLKISLKWRKIAENPEEAINGRSVIPGTHPDIEGEGLMVEHDDFDEDEFTRRVLGDDGMSSGSEDHAESSTSPVLVKAQHRTAIDEDDDNIVLHSSDEDNVVSNSSSDDDDDVVDLIKEALPASELQLSDDDLSDDSDIDDDGVDVIVGGEEVVGGRGRSSFGMPATSATTSSSSSSGKAPMPLGSIGDSSDELDSDDESDLPSVLPLRIVPKSPVPSGSPATGADSPTVEEVNIITLDAIDKQLTDPTIIPSND